MDPRLKAPVRTGPAPTPVLASVMLALSPEGRLDFKSTGDKLAVIALLEMARFRLMESICHPEHKTAIQLAGPEATAVLGGR